MIIEGSKVEMERLMATTVGKKEHEGLLKKVEQGERHYMVVDSHVKNVKAQIEREMERMVGDFMRKLQASKNVLFAQLDNYQRLYVQNMEAYRGIIEPLVSFNKKYKYFSNPNNFSIKIFN
jgi:predicted TIM-barrel fold metal-dependent hydrolase